MGRYRELLEAVSLRDIPRSASLVKREGEILIRRVVKVGVVNFSQHHHQDGHQSAGEVSYTEGSLAGEENDEHHHESDG